MVAISNDKLIPYALFPLKVFKIEINMIYYGKLYTKQKICVL